MRLRRNSQTRAAAVKRLLLKQLSEKDSKAECRACGGRGHYFVVPEGMNPFYMGALAASQAAVEKTCSQCNGTGYLPTPPSRGEGE